MDDKITIIEGPTPTFETVNEQWALGLNESPNLAGLALTRLRTFNGPALVERCYQAWNSNAGMHLEYRETDGLTKQAPIVAARNIVHDDGDVLLLWVRLLDESVELEIGYEDESSEDEDDLDLPDLPQ